MDRKNCRAKTDSTGVCKKIYKAVAANPTIRAIHSKSGRSRSPMGAITDPNQTGVQTTDNTAKTNVTLPKPVSQTKKPTAVNVHIQDHVDDVASNVELVLPQSEKHKPTNASGHGQMNKVASKKEAKPAVSSLMEEKLKQEKAAASNIIEIQGHGQGINIPPNVEPAKPHHISVQQEQPKPKFQAASILKTMSTKSHQPNLHDKGDQQGKKPEHSTVNNKFSDYITSIKNKMRTPSNVGGETKNAMPFTRLATRRDSFNNRVVNYINRARKNIRTKSNVGDV